MTEPSRVPLDPADLITDEDVATAMARVSAMSQEPSAGNYYRGALESVAPGLRARWVAEALEGLASYCEAAVKASPDQGASVLGMTGLTALRALAAEYRAMTKLGAVLPPTAGEMPPDPEDVAQLAAGLSALAELERRSGWQRPPAG
jgi:hypothetical protein